MRRIGITPGYFHPNPGRDTYSGKTLNYLERDTANYLLRHGVLPVLIPDCDGEYLEAVMAQLDGVVLQGGEDIAPESYGEKPIGLWMGDPHRDKFEFRILEAAMQRKLPVMGICRGFQLMNVFFGGTLYQDIPSQLPEATAHRDPSVYDRHYHALEFTGESALSDLYKAVPSPFVNSIHHQGIKMLAPDLRQLAISPTDGIVEAFELKAPRQGPVFGVQWHPEFGYRVPEMLDADLLLRYFLQLLQD